MSKVTERERLSQEKNSGVLTPRVLPFHGGIQRGHRGSWREVDRGTQWEMGSPRVLQQPPGCVHRRVLRLTGWEPPPAASQRGDPLPGEKPTQDWVMRVLGSQVGQALR